MEPKKTRVGFLKEQFFIDFKKAIKKNKFLHLSSPEFSNFTNKLDKNVLKTYAQAARAAKKDKTDAEEFEKYIDPAFFTFKVYTGFNDSELGMTTPELVFSFFHDNDPSPNKEYLQWYLNLYRDLIKHRKPFLSHTNSNLDKSFVQDGTYSEMLFGGAESRFFEDMFKVKEYLERFNFLKKTTSLREHERDVNKFHTFEQFMKVVKPFMTAEEGSVEVDTLDHKELRALENQVEFERTGVIKYEKGEAEGDDKRKEAPRAKLVFQNDDWVIVWTVNKEANVIFGKYTTWCTAGTKYNNMFEHYDKDGKLFVLIRKGKGSKKAIERNPMNRLQFHFHSRQFMDADDKAVEPKIGEWLESNPDIKEFFKFHIVQEVLPKKGSKYTEHIKFLLELGYGDQLIKIYKEVQPKEIQINGYKMSAESLAEIGEITSLERLTLSDMGLKELPNSLQNLKNLQYLNITNNPELRVLPTWINKLTELKSLQAMNCGLVNDIDLTGLTKLSEAALDLNPQLKAVPIGLETLSCLKFLSMSECNLTEIPDTVLKCKKLYLVDFHDNMNLRSIPVGISKLPDLHALCLDDTKISAETISIMNHNSNGIVGIVKYGIK